MRDPQACYRLSCARSSDITRTSAIDDNAFTAELALILDNRFNIHTAGVQEKRLCFKLEENPLAKLKASARNDKLFEPETTAVPGLIAVRDDRVEFRTCAIAA